MDTRYSRRFVRGGNETAVFYSVIAECEEQISGFYSELARACEVWCEERLASLEAYRERGYRTARYVIESKVVARGEREVAIAIRVTVSRGASVQETVFSEVHRWSITEGVMLPPRKKQGRAPHKGVKTRKEKIY